MKKRVLFVEDDRVLLQLYAMMMEDQAEFWEVRTAEDGRQALALLELEGKTFDVVVSDMRMPGMSGAELIQEIRKRHPHISRVIVSGISDQEEVVRCLGTTHQFLTKPCNLKTLKATLARLSSLDAYLQDEKLKALVGQLDTLPSFPSLYAEVMKELAAEEPSIEVVAQIIAKDPGMTVRMLQIVNSAAFGLVRRVADPFEAIQHLGLGSVRSVMLSAHIFSCFNPTNHGAFSADRLLDHASRTGLLAQVIMQLEKAEFADVEDAYIAGVVHDIGKLMLADHLPRQFQRAITLAAECGIPLHEAELEVLGATHAGVGAYLLGLWGLPAAIVEAVAFHHSPSSSDLRCLGPLAAVHAANVLEQESPARPLNSQRSKLDDAYLAALGVGDRLDVWRHAAAELLTPHQQ